MKKGAQSQRPARTVGTLPTNAREITPRPATICASQSSLSQFARTINPQIAKIVKSLLIINIKLISNKTEIFDFQLLIIKFRLSSECMETFGDVCEDSFCNDEPEVEPSKEPETKPSEKPETKPTEKPETKPSEEPETKPSEKPNVKPSEEPEVEPSEKPEVKPSDKPEVKPSEKPEIEPEGSGKALIS